ncbi:hypothetical protein, partial [Aequoribacter fuscus]
MSEELFDIVFLGRAIEGFDQHDVEQALAKVLKLAPEKAKILFNGKAITLKKSASKPLASKLYVQLRGIGADIKVRRNTPAPAPAPAPA